MIRLRIKEVAKAKGFSQGELSRRANIDENTLKRIYRNPLAIITTETLDKLEPVRDSSSIGSTDEASNT